MVPWIKKWLKDTQGNKCSKCGWCETHPLTGEPPLHTDHIDGDSKNNRPENLRLLCPNCHSLTPTWGVHNRGKGREIRRSHRKDSAGVAR